MENSISINYFKLLYKSIKFEEYHKVPFNHFTKLKLKYANFELTYESTSFDSILDIDEELCNLIKFKFLMIHDGEFRIKGFHLNGNYYLHESIIKWHQDKNLKIWKKE